MVAGLQQACIEKRIQGSARGAREMYPLRPFVGASVDRAEPARRGRRRSFHGPECPRALQEDFEGRGVRPSVLDKPDV
jgi:hypothetical protein